VFLHLHFKEEYPSERGGGGLFSKKKNAEPQMDFVEFASSGTRMYTDIKNY
jgi:hypothetical protein